MNGGLSLTNSIDVVANSISLIQSDTQRDINNIFMNKSSVVGVVPVVVEDKTKYEYHNANIDDSHISGLDSMIKYNDTHYKPINAKQNINFIFDDHVVYNNKKSNSNNKSFLLEETSNNTFLKTNNVNVSNTNNYSEELILNNVKHIINNTIRKYLTDESHISNIKKQEINNNINKYLIDENHVSNVKKQEINNNINKYLIDENHVSNVKKQEIYNTINKYLIDENHVSNVKKQEIHNITQNYNYDEQTMINNIMKHINYVKNNTYYNHEETTLKTNAKQANKANAITKNYNMEEQNVFIGKSSIQGKQSNKAPVVTKNYNVEEQNVFMGGTRSYTKQQVDEIHNNVITYITTQLTNYITNNTFNTLISNYVTNNNLTTVLNDYTTNNYITTKLGDYITNTYLTTKLGDLVTNTYFTTKLGDLVTKTYYETNITEKLGDYITNNYYTTNQNNYVTSTQLNNTLNENYFNKTEVQNTINNNKSINFHNEETNIFIKQATKSNNIINSSSKVIKNYNVEEQNVFIGGGNKSYNKPQIDDLFNAIATELDDLNTLLDAKQDVIFDGSLSISKILNLQTELNNRYVKTDTYTKTEVQALINALIDNAPLALDTLAELAAALNSTDSGAYVATQLALKMNISDAYDKTYINTLIGNYYDITYINTLIGSYYNKTYINTLISDYYNKAYIDTINTSLILLTTDIHNNYYTKTNITTLLTDYYTKAQILALSNLTNYFSSSYITTNFYTKSQTLALSNLTNYYNKTQLDASITTHDFNVVDAATSGNMRITSIQPSYLSIYSTDASGFNSAIALYHDPNSFTITVDGTGSVIESVKKISIFSTVEGTEIYGNLHINSGTFTASNIYNKTDVDGLLNDKISSIYLTSNYYTNTSLDSKLLLKVNTSALTAYVLSTSLTTTLSSYALSSALNSYALTSALNSYVLSTSLATTLNSYVLSTSLATTLSSYALSSALNSYALSSALNSYVLSTSLTTALSSYVLSTSLATTLSSYALSSALNSYVLSTSLNTTLSSYVTSTYLTTNYYTKAVLDSLQLVGNAYLQTQLSAYVTNTALSLKNYVEQVNLDTAFVNFASTLAASFTSQVITAGTAKFYSQGSGVTACGVVRHSNGLIMAISSLSTPASSEILLSMDMTTGVTVNHSMSITGNAQVEGLLTTNNDLQVDGNINTNGSIAGINILNLYNASPGVNPRIKMSFYANATADIYLYASNGYVAYLGNAQTGFQLSTDQATPMILKPNRFGNTTSVIIDTVGKMGVGMNATTTTPAEMLHVIGNIKSSGATNPSLTLQGVGGTNARSTINLSTYDSGVNPSTCSLIATDIGAYGANFRINMHTWNDVLGITAAQFTPFFLDHLGRMGINNTSPVANLDILGGNYGEGTCKFMSSKTGCDAISYIHYGGNADVYFRSGNAANGKVVLQDMGTGVVQVGAGTPNASDKLQVFGAITASGGVYGTSLTTNGTINTLSGKIGAGVTTPTYTLDIAAAACTCQFKSTATSDCVFNMIAGTNGKVVMKATSGGVFYIQSTTDTVARDIQFYVNPTIKAFTMSASGTCSYYSTIGAACDSKLKNDQRLVNLNDTYDIFNAIEVKSYIRNDIEHELQTNFRRIGFIAQDVAACVNDKEDFKSLVLDSTLGTNEDGTEQNIKCLNYDGLVSVLFGVCKYQKQQIQTLEERLNNIELKLSKLL